MGLPYATVHAAGELAIHQAASAEFQCFLALSLRGREGQEVMIMTSLLQLITYAQSYWLDNLRRDMLATPRGASQGLQFP